MLTGDANRSILLCLCFQLALYSIWRERNARIHGTTYNLVPRLLWNIDKLIRNRITSLDYSKKLRLQLCLPLIKTVNFHALFALIHCLLYLVS
ncbi:hypothetical protein CARUB_v10007919mg [Capsella rubella]|uniref:Uncharacterized protein n=1 Tax=Capsella rubella TaxID=81985 RepID=R0GJ52_9BRAS|nr:hypothetical protein CARUB_v10007919mg [Capsella rubella]